MGLSLDFGEIEMPPLQIRGAAWSFWELGALLDTIQKLQLLKLKDLFP